MAETIVVSLRLPAESGKSLKRLARKLDRSTAETAARLVDEGLRRSEFALIEFRDTPAGRQAHIQGTRLAVWQVVAISRAYKGDSQRTAEHLEWPVFKVTAALNYAEAFPEEIRQAIEDNQSFDFKRLSRVLPALESLEVPARVLKGR